MRSWYKTLVISALGLLFQNAYAQLAVDFTVNAPTCHNFTNGSVTASASGGTGPYSYAWSNGQFGPTINGIPGGTYTVTVTNQGNTASFQVSVVPPPPLFATTVIGGDTCNPNGTVSVIPSGGTGGYTFLWANGATTQSVSQPLPNAISVQVQDANGCNVTVSTKVFKPLGMSLEVNPANCQFQFLGSVLPAMSGGYGPFTYQWSNGSTTSFLSNVQPGFYSVTVTDANGCTISDSAEVPGLNSDVAATATATSSACPISGTGSATVSATGSLQPFSYNWSNGATTQTVGGLAAGVYTVTVSNSFNCSSTATVEIVGSDLSVSASVLNPPTCASSNGDIIAVGNGGVGNTSLLWSNGATTPVVSNVASGTYTVTITDAAGCTNVSTVTVTNVFVPINLTLNVTQPSCADGTLGSVAIGELSGGVGPFGYLWNTGAQTVSISNLSAGTYTITVTDTQGCTASSSAVIQGVVSLVLSFTDIQTADCNSNNGSVTVVVSNGVAPYTFFWSDGSNFLNSGSNSSTLTGLAGGTYTVSVTDGNGCLKVASVNIPQNSPVTAVITAPTTQLSCEVPVIPVSVSGGGSYLWNFGSLLDTIIVSLPGTYTVTVTGDDGCTDVASITITQINNAPTVEILPSVPGFISCVNDEVTLTAVSNPAYEYLWSNGSIASSITVTGGGLISVTVTDPSNGCNSSDVYEVIVNQQTPDINISGGTLNCVNTQVLLQANTNGGGAQFVWNNGALGPFISVADPGVYTVTVTSVINGCSNVASTLVAEDIAVPSVFIDSDGTTTLTCSQSSITLNAVSTAGSYTWSTGSTVQSIVVSNAGTYTVTVTAANGCTSSSEVTITQDEDFVSVQITGDLTVTCSSPNTLLNASSNNPNVVYTWANLGNVGPFVSVPCGTYTVTATDLVTGCSSSASVSIDCPPVQNVEVLVNSPNAAITCVAGSVTVTAESDGDDLAYAWSNGGSSAQNTFSAPGLYTVTVTNNETGCTGTATYLVELDQNPPVVSISPAQPSINCFNPGPITLTAEGGVGYLWSTQVLSQTISVNPSTTSTYTVTVVGSNGCTASASTVVEVNNTPPTVGVTSNITTVNCSTPSAVLTATGGVTYQWSNQQTGGSITVTPTSTTTYTVTVTGTNGCTASSSISISVNLTSPPVTVAASSTSLNCTTTSAALSAAGGQSYAWSNGANTATITVSPTVTTTYTVTATGANGCTATTQLTIQVNVTPPTVMVMPASATINCNNPGPVSISATGGQTYEWDPNGETGASISVNPAATTTYVVTATGSNGCTATQSVVVSVDKVTPNAGLTATPASINPGGSSTLTASGGGSYTWSNNGQGASQTVTPTTTTTYTVTVTGANGCTATSAVTVVVIDATCGYPNIFVPNAFSPNADNTNDRFRARGESLTSVKLVVYNRWGQRVYEETATGTSAQLQGWDGRFDGALVAPDVYGWYLEVKCANGNDFFDRGNVTVFR